MSDSNSEPTAPTNERPELNLFGSGPAPPQLIDGWGAFLDLPDSARKDIWPLLAGVLTEPTNPENERRLDIFVDRHGAPADVTAAAVNALVELLRNAAAVGLPTKAFAADLIALSDGRPGHEVILERYDQVVTELRMAILQGSLADHGKLLTSADWRLDRVAESDRGSGMDAPVLLLTLGYQEGRKSDRITLQLLPDGVRKLKSILSRFED
jgi:hypothetical protein